MWYGNALIRSLTLKQMILIYDPELGCTMPTGKIASSVSTCFVAYEKEGFFKSSYGSFSIIEEFLKQAIEKQISLELITIIYRINDNDIEIKASSKVEV